MGKIGKAKKQIDSAKIKGVTTSYVTTKEFSTDQKARIKKARKQLRGL